MGKGTGFGSHERSPKLDGNCVGNQVECVLGGADQVKPNRHATAIAS